MKAAQRSHGLVATFADSERLLEAARRTYDAGYRHIDAFTPLPIEGLPEALGFGKAPVPLHVLVGGITGAATGYVMQWWAMAADYPLNTGGRPFHSWPAFVPITFELTILAGALAAVVSLLVSTRLPRPHHPLFNVPGFERASTDRFFLCVESRDPKYEGASVRAFLEQLGADRVEEVSS